jgi:hypothetical protein
MHGRMGANTKASLLIPYFILHHAARHAGCQCTFHLRSRILASSLWLWPGDCAAQKAVSALARL